MKDGEKHGARRRLIKALALAGAGGAFPGIIRAQGDDKPYAGTTLNVSVFSGTFQKLLRGWIPEFEKQTGIKVNYDTPSFPIYNQRTDLELSTQGSGLDVANLTFIYSGRWIGAGWFTPLDDFIARRTPASWDLDDILPGARAPETGADGKLYAIPWNVEVVLAAAARFDLVREAGLDFPQTTDEFLAVLKAVNKKDRSAGFATDNHYGWTFPPYLHAFGGDVFVDAPGNLLPALDTPQAIAAADYFAHLLRDYGPDGVITYTTDQTVQSLKTGRTNFSTMGQSHLSLIGDARSSKTVHSSAFGLIPAGPEGRFPGVAVHGLGIPLGARNKEAAWEFIKWATSSSIALRAVEAGYGSPARRSALASPAYAQRQNINGYDLSSLAIESVDLAAKGGYMKYRTVPVFPQVDQQLNKAIELIVSGQYSAQKAMQQAQAQSVAELKRAGIKL
jgi:multiple sugar transport system substrate-binding protein